MTAARFACDAFVVSMQNLRAKLPGLAMETLFAVADAAREQVQHTDRFKTQTGTLKARTYSQLAGRGVDLVADTPYAYWVENGRRGFSAGRRQVLLSHGGRRRIGRMKTGKKMLRFVINGQVFFRRSVGAARPRRFMEEAAWAGVYAVPEAADEILSPAFAA